jgi:hypothetical protein
MHAACVLLRNKSDGKKEYNTNREGKEEIINIKITVSPEMIT